MGVHGLTTYLRENQRILSTSFTLPTKPQVLTPVVVDGWSFIYDLHLNSHLPWVYGGEYDKLSSLVSVVVEAWIRIGFKIYFVFDGACPRLKFPTLISRLGQSHIQPSLLFFRTSSVSRSAPRFLNEARIIPPLAYAACLHALEAIRQTTDLLEIHFADEEGDPYAVELAGRIGAYVVGNDSDFVILHSDGYLGYIPLDQMTWHAPALAANPPLEEDSEFQAVRKPKAARKSSPDSLFGSRLPPDVEGLTLSFTAYKPATLAVHLKIPVTLLPLLGALVGNDFSIQRESSRRNVQSLFFERRLTLVQRIDRVAETMQAVLSSAQKRKRQNHKLASVMDLICSVVNALLGKSITTLGSGEVGGIVDNIVEGTLQYAIPRYEGDTSGQDGLWATDVCALHKPEICPLLPMISRLVETEDTRSEEKSEELRTKIVLRATYIDAYRKGRISPRIMDILNTGTFWPRLFLENPDLETVGRSIGRPIRQWGYAILHDALGLPVVEEEEDVDVSEVPSDEDELIDVVESDDEDSAGGNDLLAPLKGELQRLHGSGKGAEPPTLMSTKMSHPSQPLIVTEYIRRGTRIAQEAVVVRPLSEMLSSIRCFDVKSENSTPLLLRPQTQRFTLFLQVLESDIPPIRILPREQVMAALCLRWVLRITYIRAQETNSKDRDKERWTRREARCFLASFCWTASTTAANQHGGGQDRLPIVDRNVQLMAQALLAMGEIEHLSQILLLSECFPPIAHRFSGERFHACLTRVNALSEIDIPTAVLEASFYGLDDVFMEERKEKRKKSKGGTVTPLLANSKKGPPNGGLFQLLADIET